MCKVVGFYPERQIRQNYATFAKLGKKNVGQFEDSFSIWQNVEHTLTYF